jgi:hypothetical protein
MLPWNLPIGAHVMLTARMFCSGSLLRMLLFVLERLLVGGRSVFFFGIFSFLRSRSCRLCDTQAFFLCFDVIRRNRGVCHICICTMCVSVCT